MRSGDVTNLAFAPLLVLRGLAPDRDTVDADVARWVQRHSLGDLRPSAAFVRVARAWPEFRSVLYMRLRHGSLAARVVGRVLSAVYRPMPLLVFQTSRIGPGLFVEHGFATVVSAHEIGEGCQINQQVTVGWTGRGKPRIGSHVEIGAGAKVLGPVTVGDCAWIGANAVVVRDVPAGMTAVGVPAQMRPHGAEPDGS